MAASRKKICIVTTSLDHGGAERAAATQSIIFSNLGFNVFIVTVKSGVVYEYKGELYDLGLYKDKNNSAIGRISRLLKLKRFLGLHKFDYIVDNRPRNQAYREFVVSCFIYKAPTIYVLHSFEQVLAFTKFNWLNRFLYRNEQMVCVSKKGAEKFKNLYDLHNIITIYNAFDFDKIRREALKEISDSIDGDYIIFYGRIQDKSKNLKLLLKSYVKSKLRAYNVKLVIMGDGEDVDMIKTFITQHKIEEFIILKPFNNNPFPWVKEALCSTLTSRSEGFAMVIPETMCLGVPVISVACEAGPKEIISHKENGLLVENNNPEELARAFNLFVEDKGLYNRCKENTKASVERFSMEQIAEQWESLLK